MKGMHDALSYLERGWSVLPLEPRSKLPATNLIKKTRGTSSWSTYKDRHASADEVAAWHELEPEHNCGVLCGQTSGNLAVVDVDHELPSDVTIPATATVRTGRGRQFYATSETPAATQRFTWGELRSEGSYVAAPRSVHPSGRIYEWEQRPDMGIASLDEFALPFAPRAEVSLPTHLSGLLGLPMDSLDAAQARAAALGISFTTFGKPFHCVLHQDTSPSVTLWPRRDTGEVLYHEFHHGSGYGEEWLSLPKVRARLAGRDGPLSNSEFVTWALRLDIEAGIRTPSPIQAGQLPLDATEGARVVWDGFLRLFKARWLHTIGEPAPFSHRFAASWCGCARTTVEKHFPELRRLGLVRYAGRDARGTSLWLPGEGVRPLRGVK